MIAHYNTTASDRSHIYMCILFGEKHDCVALHDVILHVIIILYVVVDGGRKYFCIYISFKHTWEDRTHQTEF